MTGVDQLVERLPISLGARLWAWLTRLLGWLFADARARRAQRIPSTAVDRSLDYLGLMRDLTIKLELELATRIDLPRLERALALLMDAEPVLGCRYVNHWWRPYWERLPRGAARACRVVETAPRLAAYALESIDIADAPPIALGLWRGPEADRLVLKMDHHATDAGGVLETARLLGDIYNRLAADPTYRPPQNHRGSRSMGQVMRRIPLRAYPRIWINYARAALELLGHPRALTLPFTGRAAGERCFVERTIGAATVRRIVAYGRARGATINDVVLAACFRALARLGRPGNRDRLRLVTTVSNRRYLPGGRGAAITNLCGMEYPCLGADAGPDLAATLARVTAITTARKASWPGLNDYVGQAAVFLSPLPQRWMTALYRRLIRRGLGARAIPHSLSNVGRIDPAAVCFGRPATAARILPGASRSPLLFNCLSGYAGRLSLAACVDTNDRALTERYFDAVLAELGPAGAGPAGGPR